MSVLCHGGCHVYLTGQLRCQCGAAANGYPPVSGVMYGHNPFAPHVPHQAPASDVPLAVFKAAKDDAKATHLSADGLRAYRDDRGGIEVAHWDEETRKFDSWWSVAEMAADAVKM